MTNTIESGAKVIVTGYFLNGRRGEVVGRYAMSDTGDEWLVQLDGKTRPTAVRGSDLRINNQSHLRLA